MCAVIRMTHFRSRNPYFSSSWTLSVLARPFILVTHTHTHAHKQFLFLPWAIHSLGRVTSCAVPRLRFGLRRSTRGPEPLSRPGGCTRFPRRRSRDVHRACHFTGIQLWKGYLPGFADWGCFGGRTRGELARFKGCSKTWKAHDIRCSCHLFRVFPTL